MTDQSRAAPSSLTVVAPTGPAAPRCRRPPALPGVVECRASARAGAATPSRQAHRLARRGAWLASLALLAPSALAHDLQHTVAPAQALVVELRYPDGSPFAFEAYEVHRDGDTVPYQVGRTDTAGRIAFLPDGPATWRVRAFSEDGHGLDVRVESTAAGAVEAAGSSAYDRFTRIAVGVGVILGLFGILTLFVRRRSA